MLAYQKEKYYKSIILLINLFNLFDIIYIKPKANEELKGLMASQFNGLNGPFTLAAHKAIGFKVGGMLKVG